MNLGFKGFWVLFFASSFNFAYAALTTTPECYEFENQNNPAGIEFTLPTVERWCYQKQSIGSDQGIFIFNADSDEPRPELSAFVLIGKSGRAEKMSAGSLAQGVVQFSALSDLGLNPFIAPLTLHDARLRGKPSALKYYSSKNQSDDQTALLLWAALSAQNSGQSKDVGAAPVNAGDYSASVTSAVKPFNGFWWSAAGVPMATGTNSPLGIYDSGITARTGTNPHSVDWEQVNHSDTGVAWGGHCNGWAASTVLYAEPTQTLYDSLTETMVTPYAQKGMLAEASFCVNHAFYGKRYNSTADDLYDIKPDLFHKVLTYYIQSLNKTVIMDYERGAMVDNNVITGYKFHIVKKSGSGNSQTFHVDAVLTIAQYDIELRDSLGKAGTYEKSYAYTLTTDKNGAILSGKWDSASDNPDFMWVPLSAAENCASRNPNVSPAKLASLLKNLSPVSAKYQAVNFQANQDLIPQGQIPLPLMVKAADKMKLRMLVNSLTPNQEPGTLLIISGDARYPVTGGAKESMFIKLTLGEQMIPLDRLLSVDSAAIVNQSETVATHVNIIVHGLDSISY